MCPYVSFYSLRTVEKQRFLLYHGVKKTKCKTTTTFSVKPNANQSNTTSISLQNRAFCSTTFKHFTYEEVMCCCSFPEQAMELHIQLGLLISTD